MSELTHNDISKLQKEARKDAYITIRSKLISLQHKLVDDETLFNNPIWTTGVSCGYLAVQTLICKLLEENQNETKESS